MPTLVIFIVLSFAFYVFYKMKYVRSNRPAERKWLSGKSSIALGLFVGLFGVNQLFLYSTTTTYVISSIFILIGVLSIWAGYKAYKTYLPLAIKEFEQLNGKN
ncbi:MULTISPECIES: YtpI family protein [unclassified Bacillus (in: firmicutes)]|uniref:YtpI family protein n=1 Tax=unclassified Bacillus (in: firmicutes) TaxID=185979 RepID=UPI0008E0BAB9|nr:MULTISPECIES: YtpI family protein [unclassified Bacillus (in: firmicutes)]SFB17410.1 YtpI-like protein [Bacillus sp. UNCCL13]SFQ77139.1 YtpI-like protein [Bacillus sp. cl95]